MQLDRILRYPVKSLSVEDLHACTLSPGQGLPFDRHWALARPDGDAVDNPTWHAKSHFLVLAREYGLALVKSHFDETTGRLSLTAPDGLHAEGKLNTLEGRTAIAEAIAKHLGLDETETPHLVEAQDIGYFDTTRGPVSLLNMNSVRALEKLVSVKFDPRRFRMNFLLEGIDAWAETLWSGQKFKIGDAVLEITQSTGRCKATHVNPDTGELDMKVLHALKEHYGHTQMGVYAIVAEGGKVTAGDQIEMLK